MAKIDWARFNRKPGNELVLTVVSFRITDTTALVQRYIAWFNRPISNVGLDRVRLFKMGPLHGHLVPGSRKGNIDLEHPFWTAAIDVQLGFNLACGNQMAWTSRFKTSAGEVVQYFRAGSAIDFFNPPPVPISPPFVTYVSSDTTGFTCADGPPP